MHFFPLLLSWSAWSETPQRTSIDCFMLHSLQSWPDELGRVMSLNISELFLVAKRGRLAVQSAFSGEAVTARVSHLLNFLKSPADFLSVAAAPRIGIFVQLHYLELWQHLKPCIETVLKAAKNHTVDVILTTTHPLEDLADFLPALHASAPSALRFSVLSRAENRGADIGVFLQQLLLARELSLGTDLILKLHSKGHGPWRKLMVSDLCGSVQIVQSIVDQFVGDPTLGMVGPLNFTWTKQGPTGHVAFGRAPFGFEPNAVRNMRIAWSFMSSRDLPPKSAWTIVAGSFYWVRAGLMEWEEEVLPRISALLGIMGAYKTNCCRTDVGCCVAYGLERIMPTLVATRGRVAAGPGNHPPSRELTMQW